MGRHRPHAGENVEIIEVIEVIEIIEISAAPGPARRRTASDDVDRPRRHVRPVKVAAAVVTALLLVGSAVAVWWPEPDWRPTVTDSPRFAVDAPAGWETYAANLLSPPDVRSWFGLWAAPADGRWLLVEMVPAERMQETLVDATRSLVGSFEAATPAGRPEQRRIEVPLGRVRAVITGSAVSGRDLAATLAELAPPPVGTNELYVTPPDGLELVASGPSLDALLYGEQRGQVVYRAADTGEEVAFTSGRAVDGDTAAAVLDVVGPDPDRRLLRDERDGVVFTVESTLSVDETTLQQFLSGARAVDEAMWQRMLASRRPGLQLGPLLQLADGLTTEGRRWTAGVRLADRDGEDRFGWAAAPLDTPLGPPFGPRPDSPFRNRTTITSLVVPGATYVFAALPRAQITSTTAPPVLHITVAGRAVDVPFVDLRAELPMVFAAYAFDEPVAFTARLVDE